VEKSLPISPEEFELIEKYLLNQMEQIEKKQFEQNLNANPALKQKLEESRLMLLGIKEASLESRLAEFHSATRVVKLDQPKISSVVSMKKWLAAAAVVIVVGIAAFLIFSIDGNERIFNEYYRTDPGLVTAMSNEADHYEFEKAMVEYKTGEYDKALATWEKLLTITPQNDTLQYFIGSAYLAKKDAVKAIPFLQQVADNTGSFFHNDAIWYLGLALLKEGKQKEAIAAINRTEHAGKSELLQQLNSK
jgi:tetratricopeptide (TPR) repeat protein